MQQQIKQRDIDNAVQVQSTYMLSVFSSHVKTIAVCVSSAGKTPVSYFFLVLGESSSFLILPVHRLWCNTLVLFRSTLHTGFCQIYLHYTYICLTLHL